MVEKIRSASFWHIKRRIRAICAILKTFLDEGVPEGLEQYLAGHEVSTVKRESWNSIKNGKLLDLIEKSGFKALITNDKRMEREQQLKHRPFATLVLSTNHWPTMGPNVDKILQAVDDCRPGTVIRVECGQFVPSRFRRYPAPLIHVPTRPDYIRLFVVGRSG